MSHANGRLPASALAPIPGGQLRKDAAVAWNAMCDRARRQGRPIPRPGGPDSSYRPLARQHYWKRWWTLRGKPQNAATPGSSNHGEGTAVDDPATVEQQTIAAVGAPFGWQKQWSDAAWEPWHFKWRAGDYPAVRAARRDPMDYLTATERRWAREYQALYRRKRNRRRRVVLRAALTRARKRAWRAMRKRPSERARRRYAVLAHLTR